MTPNILDWIQRHRPERAGRVLEVGSYDINGSPRNLFQDATSYLGIDSREGPGVDRVCAAGALFPGTYDTVMCLETLEHDLYFWQTLEALHALVAPGGALIITTPDYGFPVHRYPVDCYRFGEDTYRDLFFADFVDVQIQRVQGPTWCGMGRKKE